jgi:hypothetical protein
MAAYVFVFLIRKNKHHFMARRQNIAVTDTIKNQQNSLHFSKGCGEPP